MREININTIRMNLKKIKGVGDSDLHLECRSFTKEDKR